MKKFFTMSVLAGLCCCIANADVTTWTLKDVKFANGGVATGSFGYDPLTNAYSGIDITTPGATYTVPPDFVVTGGDLASSATLLELQDSGGMFELTLRFLGPLTAAGGSVQVDIGPQFAGRVSRESGYDSSYIPTYDNITGGSVTAAAAVPEPGSVLLLLTAIGGAAVMARRKRRK